MLQLADGTGRLLQGESHIYGEEGDALVLAAPRSGNGLLPVATGSRVTIRGERGTKAFEAEVAVREIRSVPEDLLLVDKPTVVTESSRRRFFRVETDAPAWIGDQPARLLNLSGSGALIAVGGVRPEPGQEILLRLGLPGQTEPLAIPCRVVRVRVLEDQGRVHVAFTFGELPERDRDHLFRFLFAAQRQLLRKGLGR